MGKVLKMISGGALIALVSSGITLATPTTGVSLNTILSTGIVDSDIHAEAQVAIPALEEDFGAVVFTAGASNIIQQEIKFLPGGTTGWHVHPGIVILTLAADSGPVDWYDSKCGRVTYNPGDSWTEGTKLHDVVNHGSTVVHFLVTYIVAESVSKRTDEAAPRCASALGLL